MCTIIFIAMLFMIISGVRGLVHFYFFLKIYFLFLPIRWWCGRGGGFVPVMMTNTISPKKKNIELARTKSY